MSNSSFLPVSTSNTTLTGLSSVNGCSKPPWTDSDGGRYPNSQMHWIPIYAFMVTRHTEASPNDDGIHWFHYCIVDSLASFISSSAFC